MLSREHILHRPRNPISPRIAMSVPGESRPRENSGEDMSAWRSACADSRVAEFWELFRTSSNTPTIGSRLGNKKTTVSKSLTKAGLVLAAYR